MAHKLILERLGIRDTTFGGLQQYMVLAWTPLEEGKTHMMNDRWTIYIPNERVYVPPGVCSGHEGTGEIRMPCYKLPDYVYPEPVFGVQASNSRNMEQAVLDFNIRYGNNKDITIDDVIWEGI
jgi:hypothetical protein